MFNRMRRFFAPPVFEDDEDKTRVAGLLNVILLCILAVAGMIGLAAPFALPSPVVGVVVAGSMFLLCLGALFLMHRGYVQPASLIAVSLQWITYVVLVLLTGGMTSLLSVGLFTAVMMAGLLLSGLAALAVAGLSILVSLGIVAAESAGFLPTPLLLLQAGTAWLVLAANLLLGALILYLAARSLNQALGRARHLAGELEGQREHLEETVEARTHDLTRRTRYLEATAAISQEAAGVLDVQELLTRVATLISERFGFYHAGVFLLDASREWAVLQAASSAGGERMLARGHRLRVAAGGRPGEGIVGYVTGRNRPRVALDVGQDAVFFDNPDLPETHSEMALPLRARGEVIGALDVQSREPGAFSDEDVAVLQTLADQVALAISNARLFRQAQESLEAERRAYGELSREAWNKLLRGRPDLGFLRNEKGVSPAGDVWHPEMEAALQSGQPVATADDARGVLGSARGGLGPGEPGLGDAAMGQADRLAIPIKVGGHVIGVVNVQRSSKGGMPEGAPEYASAWSPEEIQLMETLSEQLGVALESARLYADTQRRAAQEQLVGEVTARMRATLDVNTVLQTAVQEMRQAMGYAEVEVLLDPGPAGPEVP
ncbi:MAG: GAF domain-containing protein [Anaerolineae bacterium]|nr:GAF domain-containing protein [Anaerolineae bacterium]